MGTALDLKFASDVALLEAIHASMEYAVVVEHQGVWRKGIRCSSIHQANAAAEATWQRSHLRVEVRDKGNNVVSRFPAAQ